jgi:hypothetical protein
VNERPVPAQPDFFIALGTQTVSAVVNIKLRQHYAINNTEIASQVLLKSAQ